MAERVIIVSSDSHAGMPKELWEDYLPQKFHDLLPRLRHDNVIYPTAMKLQTLKLGVMSHPEHAAAHESGWQGLYDPVLRMADMDREGVAAELVFLGDNRLGDLFHNVTNDAYPFDAWQAGAQAWNRWLSDAHGFATERFLLTGAIGPAVDMDATVGELQWIADHDFTGTYAPGYVHHAGNPPLYDDYWEPFWSVCEDTGLAVVVHAGFGTERGEVYPQVKRMYDDCARAAGSTDAAALYAHADAISDESLEYFFNFFAYNVEARRPLWQLMLGGVFDRHPELRFVATEIRLDWIPATLRLLDRVYEEHRDALPAQRRPSEYWHSNCLGGASFVHKAEIEMRHEIGIETMSFGRDFPHPEGSWPHTREWLLDAFVGLPEAEARAILGENAIRILGLDRDRLAQIAKRIGPTVEEVVGGGDVKPDLVANFDLRGGYLKPAEGEARLPLVEDAVRTDLARLGVTG
jgi:predicted TIM-barrel fold metal-dependent hydrolase